ncbi:MAG: D-aminopeptidase (EC [uncultured Paraburkholderia sp.]|nr:MAG: D-aminopeptidase (EC [uncultured Paraburkholderia sp.]CAH2800544.1 MAG: D-aminopeptidase (EC [uncultured Paraburkholderia sp.]CAH2935865.1 MAG: D-aminopeptidase (EC [uncultured Paraburkholderia sp.]CAH2937116.1 MAG: D-aminopeptidase (EC [uncultured Paraburkholderia sp.]
MFVNVRRSRDVGLFAQAECGPANAVTDVPGIQVGYTTLKDHPKGILTGVTAILPRPREALTNPINAGTFSLNGNGELTGTHWIEEAGWFVGPIVTTSTYSLGICHHAAVRWMLKQFPDFLTDGAWYLPVVAETYDGWLNDIARQTVTESDVISALDTAASGIIAERSVGGGTGMIAYEYKAGTGTASRRISIGDEVFTLGVLVQANHGLRPWLRIDGMKLEESGQANRIFSTERGSIIVVVATDAPLLPHQLKRIARRASIGIGRGGTPSTNNSGDIFLAFSTANDQGSLPENAKNVATYLSNDLMDHLFLAAVDCIEEAVLNSMLAAEPTEGKLGRKVEALDPEMVREMVNRR